MLSGIFVILGGAILVELVDVVLTLQGEVRSVNKKE